MGLIRYLVVFFLAFNLFAGMLITTGTDAVIGIDAHVGEDDEVQNVKDQTDDVSTGNGLGATLFAMYNALASTVGSVFNFIFPGLLMLERAGVPSYITGFLGPIFTVAIAFNIASYLRGYNL